MKDAISSQSPILTFGPVSPTADVIGATVDLAGFESAAIELQVGIGGITFTDENKIAFVAEHSDDGSVWVKVADKDINGKTGITDGILLSLEAAHAAPVVYKYGYHGGKRYLRVSSDFSGTHGTGTPMSCLIVRGNPERKVV